MGAGIYISFEMDASAEFVFFLFFSGLQFQAQRVTLNAPFT